MEYIYSVFNNIMVLYNSVNSATLSGAIDVVVVEHPDGSFVSTPFHVRFGKYGVFNYTDKYIRIQINDKEIDIKMKLSETGVAFFVNKAESDEKIPKNLATSPIVGDAPNPNPIKLSAKIKAIRSKSESDLSNSTKEANNSQLAQISRSCFALISDNTEPDWKWGQIPKSEPSSDSEGDEEDDEREQPKYKRSLNLSSAQLKSLNLTYGSNEACFSITSKFQGTAFCNCHIFLIKWTEKIVISDIDGTITKSDLLGHLLPYIGGDWAQIGVAELYTRIKNNGYRMIYLSSRAIGMSTITKKYLKSIKQGAKQLPDGPVLLSPVSVLMSFRRELIDNKADEFKIACLTNLREIFPNIRQPFFAGFGNRETDTNAYRSLNIPPERIFIINSSGILLRMNLCGYSTDFTSIANNAVDYIFPHVDNTLPIDKRCYPFYYDLEMFSTFRYWKNTPPLDMWTDKAALEKYEKRRLECGKQKARKK